MQGDQPLINAEEHQMILQEKDTVKDPLLKCNTLFSDCSASLLIYRYKTIYDNQTSALSHNSDIRFFITCTKKQTHRFAASHTAMHRECFQIQSQSTERQADRGWHGNPRQTPTHEYGRQSEF